MSPKYRVVNLNRHSEIGDEIVVAGTSTARRKGLLESTLLKQGAGLWIAPCEAVHTFGMQFALDLIFLDRDHRVCKLVPGLLPRRVGFSLSAHSVLELAEGAILRSATQVGDRLRFHAGSEH